MREDLETEVAGPDASNGPDASTTTLTGRQSGPTFVTQAKAPTCKAEWVRPPNTLPQRQVE